MPIPDFEEPTGYLPEGSHPATLEEIRDRFATNFRRREIFQGLSLIVARLRACTVSDIWVDGSFVTDIPRPQDVDVVYDGRGPGVDQAGLLDGRLRVADRQYNKHTYRVDLWPMPSFQQKQGRSMTIKEFFQSDDGNVPKGIVQLVMPAQEEGSV